MLSHLINMFLTPSPFINGMIDLLPFTMSYASTSAQYGLLTHPPVKRMIALLPNTMSYVGICAQHCPHTKPPLKSYDSITTYYYVICYYICLHGLYTKPL